MSDIRLFVKKKDGYLVESETLTRDLKQALKLPEDFRAVIYNIYDIYNADERDIALLKENVLAETVTDEVLEQPDTEGKQVLAYEYLPGQYDQRGDSAQQCLMLLNNKNDVRIHSGTLLVMEGIDEEQRKAIAAYQINPVEAREKDLSVLDDSQSAEFQPVPVVEGFTAMDQKALEEKRQEWGLAMSLQDLAFIQEYFREEEHRDPTMTEIRVLDTYWSDHCRHTTFETILSKVEFKDATFRQQMQDAWNLYLSLRQETGREEKPITLMDMASIYGRAARKRGELDDEEISDEINACSIEIPVDVNGEEQTWLLMFKNETHNHPTEIEPFGGASTCIGGAIRDPLSGRSYVYQAVRITGAGDITKPVEETLEHKLPQSKISKTAAHGYSSYGNQIGLATTFVEEIFDEGYTAKRMEVGGVVGAAPKSHVKREKPEPGDVIVLIGGATGRDGIGGATGSSKEHNDTSLEKCSSEVQKGNALVERKLQRLFRNPAATRLIKKANDFGAGGVSVAVGELADGLDIDLNAVPVKYAGLDGTELAISESQERMAVCIAAEDLPAFEEECRKENLEAFKVADVTDTNRLVMHFMGDTIVDMSRSFLDTNGVRQKVDVLIEPSEYDNNPFAADDRPLEEVLQDAGVASQIGLAEMFDASIGKSTVLMPFGGKHQRTPEDGSVQKLPVDGFTNTCSFMTYGYSPELSKFSPYLGAQYSVVEALCRLAALGADPLKARLSNQEYFQRLNHDPEKWGAPVQALLGLIEAEAAFGTPAIGGKDSMSGTFNQIHVPPTLITFAVTYGDTHNVISSAFKKPGSYVYLLQHTPGRNHAPSYAQLKKNFASLQEENQDGNVLAAKTIKNGGIAAAAAKMAFGNGIGADLQCEDPNGFNIGSLLVETARPVKRDNWVLLGQTTENPEIILNGESTPLASAFRAWTKRYDGLYPRSVDTDGQKVTGTALHAGKRQLSAKQVDKPVVVIPVFPGQNCELDTKAQFERAGGEVHTVVFNNLTVENLQHSIDVLADEIRNGQILMVVGGFSLGDEPDGSGKFIASVLRNPKIAEAIEEMRANDGLILGICNGFQALVKSGLLPAGDVHSVTENSPTLFRNNINRHVSHIGRTRITSTKSPWLQDFEPGQTFSVAFSHGEGRFMAPKEVLDELNAKGMIATQYVDNDNDPTMNGEFNINGSDLAIEGILSEDGRIFGKMGHSERWEEGLFQNIDGDRNQHIFENGIRFFTHK